MKEICVLKNSQKDLIIKLHKQSNSQMKADLEKAFSEDIDFPNMLHDLINRAKESVSTGHPALGRVIPYGTEYIIVTLPNANAGWTFYAFDLVKEIVTIATIKGYSAYPIHNFSPSTEFLKEHNITNYIVVRVSE